MMNDQIDEIIELLESLKNRYQKKIRINDIMGLSLIMFIYCIINIIK